jgi:hypothetical protein
MRMAAEKTGRKGERRGRSVSFACTSLLEHCVSPSPVHRVGDLVSSILSAVVQFWNVCHYWEVDCGSVAHTSDQRHGQWNSLTLSIVVMKVTTQAQDRLTIVYEIHCSSLYKNIWSDRRYLWLEVKIAASHFTIPLLVLIWSPFKAFNCVHILQSYAFGCYWYSLLQRGRPKCCARVDVFAWCSLHANCKFIYDCFTYSRAIIYWEG